MAEPADGSSLAEEANAAAPDVDGAAAEEVTEAAPAPAAGAAGDGADVAPAQASAEQAADDQAAACDASAAEPAPAPEAAPPGPAPLSSDQPQTSALAGQGPSAGSRGGQVASEGAIASSGEAAGSPVKRALDLKHERLTGVVARAASNGSGVITSHMFEGSVSYASPSGIMFEFQGHPLRDGEAVEFDVQADGHGRAQAVVVKPLLGRRPEECLGQRHRGYIRRFADRWGFLNSAAFDGDLFVHRDNILPSPDLPPDGQPLLRSGQAVEFDIRQDDRNRTVAKQITTRAQMRPGDWIGKRLRGYIRSFQGAWGFINSEHFAGDLFVHRDSLVAGSQGAEITTGMLVEFTIEHDNHRRGERNRLVARQVMLLPTQVSGALPQAAMSSAYACQDPAQAAAAAAAAASYPVPGYGVPAQYPYPGVHPYGAQYPGLPMQPYPPQPFYGQQPYGAPPYPLASAPPAPAMGSVAMAPQPGAPQPPMPQQVAQQATQPVAAVPMPGQQPSAPQPVPGDVKPKGELHIATRDWEPDQPGQLWVTRGTLVTVSCRADHGWAYAGTVQPGSATGAPASEGWLPQAVVKRVSLCRVSVDWTPEGNNTLGVAKGEIIAVSKEAERGWVYGEHLGPRGPTGASEGWLPKKALEYLQS